MKICKTCRHWNTSQGMIFGCRHPCKVRSTIRELLFTDDSTTCSLWEMSLEGDLSEQMLCLDPGLTTGYAVFSGTALIEYGSFKMFLKLKELFERRWDVCLCEKLTPATATFRYESLYVVGVAQFLCWESKTPFIFRAPQFMRAPRLWGYAIDEHVKDDHAADAVAHGVAYLGVDKVTAPKWLATRSTSNT